MRKLIGLVVSLFSIGLGFAQIQPPPHNEIRAKTPTYTLSNGVASLTDGAEFELIPSTPFPVRFEFLLKVKHANNTYTTVADHVVSLDFYFPPCGATCEYHCNG